MECVSCDSIRTTDIVSEERGTILKIRFKISSVNVWGSG